MTKATSSVPDSGNNLVAAGKSGESPHGRFSGRTVVRSAAVLVVATFLFIVLTRSFDDPNRYFMLSISSVSSRNQKSNFSQEDIDTLELKKILDNAAMEDKKTVIITTVNSAWMAPNSIFDLFLESFRIGNGTHQLLKHLLVVALDKDASSRCMDENLHCYELTTPGVDFSGEKFFMTGDYLRMMWRRIEFLRIVLELGYNFVFTDADVMWFRNPFPRFFPRYDFQIACDFYRYDPNNRRNSPNGGFVYVRSNDKTVQFYNFWYNAQEQFPGKHDQDVLNKIKFDPFIDRIGLEMRFLETAYFGGFCEPSKDLDKVVTMHANCCIGLENKVHDIKMVIGDWKKYSKNSSITSWTMPRKCKY